MQLCKTIGYALGKERCEKSNQKIVFFSYFGILIEKLQFHLKSNVNGGQFPFSSIWQPTTLDLFGFLIFLHHINYITTTRILFIHDADKKYQQRADIKQYAFGSQHQFLVQ